MLLPKKIMRPFRTLLFLFVVAALQATPFQTPADWIFTAEFPTQPKVLPQRAAGDVLQTTVVCDSGSTALIAIRAEYLANIPTENIAAVYDAGRDAMLKSMSADLVKEEKIAIDGHEGRRYVIEAKNRARRGEFRVIFIGNELYQFMFGTKDALDAKAAESFFSRIKKRGAKDR